MLGLVLAIATAAWAASDAGWVTTGQQGAQTGINTSATSRFTITATASAVIKGGDFVMKAGSATTAPISFKLYDSIDKSNLIAQFTYVNANAFCAAHGGDCQTFSSTRFPFSTPIPIAAGKSYYAELTSPAPSVQSLAYFIKGGDQCRIVTETGDIVPGTDCSGGFVPPPKTASLSVIKKGPATATAPGQISYTLAVSNGGDGASSGASIRDQLPAGMIYNGFSGSGWNCSAAGNPALISCRYNYAVQPGGVSNLLRITTTVDDAASSVTNWASVDPTGGNNPIIPNAQNCSAADVGSGECDNVVTTLDIAPPFLDIALSDPHPAPDNGGLTTYDVKVTNNGDGKAQQGSHAYFVLPQGTSFDSFNADGWTCSESGGIVDCSYTDGPILPGYSFDFTVTVKVDALTPGGQQFVAEAYVDRTGDVIGSKPSVCTSDDTIACVQNVFVLPYKWTVKKSDPTPDLQVGQESTYTLTVTSNGSNVPTDVKDLLPDGMTLVSASGGNFNCSASGGNLVLCEGTVSEGSPVDIMVKVTVGSTLANQTVTNYASVGPRDGTTTPGPNCLDPASCDSNTSTVLSIAGLSLTKSRPEPPLQAGQASSYTLTFETDVSGSNIDVRDTLPAGVKLVDATSSDGFACTSAPGNPFTCSKSNVPAGTPQVITVNVMVDADAPAGVVTNYAFAGPAGTVPDPGPACPLSTAFVCVARESVIIPAAVFTIDKGAPSPPLRVGQESTYAISVTTSGQDVDTEVRDLLPAGLTLVKAEGLGWFCDETILCRKTISSGTTETIEVTVIPDDGMASQQVTNYASVGPDGRAPEPGPSCSPSNRCDERTDTVNAEADYTITKSAPQPPLRVGQQSVYQLTVTTTGEEVVAEVKDQLPDGMELVSIAGEGWACDESGNNLYLCRKTVLGTASEVLNVTVNVAAETQGQTLINFASVGPEEEAPQPGPSCTPGPTTDCAESPSSTVDAPAGYQVAKSKPVPPLEVNKQSTYTITVSSQVAGVQAEVKDQLPPGLTLVSATGDGWDCLPADADNLVLCHKLIDNTGPEQILVTVDVAPEVNNQTVTNYASTGGAGNAPQPGPQCTDPDLCAESAAKVADIRDEIKDAVKDDVKAFLTARLDHIIGSFDQQSRLQRFRDTACGETHDLQLSGEATSNSANLAGSGSFSMKGGIVPTADVPPEECGRFNLWSELGVSYVDGLDDAAVKGGMLTAGAEYLVTDNFLAGVRLSIDYTEASFDSAANSEISGWGWLAGPYISAEIVKNVFLDGFIGYGTSWNNYDGSYEGLDLSGDFMTQRIAGYLNMSGNWRSGQVELTPLIGVAYGKEWSDAFDVHNAIVGDTNINSQQAELGRLTARFEAGYLIHDDPGDKLEVYLAPKVTYDLVRDGGSYADALLGDSAWRGGLEGGFRYARDRFGASLLLGYDGVGVSDWAAYQGQLQVNYSW